MNQNEWEHDDTRIKTHPVLACSVNLPASPFEKRGCPGRVMDPLSHAQLPLEVKPHRALTMAVERVGCVLLSMQGFVLLPSPVLGAVTHLETRKGEQSSPQAWLPAAQEIKLS